MRGSKACIKSARQFTRSTALGSVLLSAPLCCDSVFGQIDDGGGPIIIDRRKTLEFFHITHDYLALDFEAVFRSGETDPADGNATTDTETKYREALEYGGNAFFGHPDLFDLDYLFRWQLEQTEFDLESSEQEDSTMESILELNLTGTFVRSSDTPVTVFVTRNQNEFQRDFGGTLDNVNTEIGASMNILNVAFPSYFALRHIELDQRNSLDRTQFEQKRDIFEWIGSTNLAESQRLWWDTSYETVDESGNLRSTNSYDRMEISVNHEYLFGNDQEHRLLSSARILDESGDLNFKNLRWDERLLLKHSQTLRTDYFALFDRTERSGTTQTLMSGSANLRHDLFESLTTNASVGASQLQLDADDFTSTDQFGHLNFDYTKKVPYGKLFATADLGVNFQDESDRGTPIFLNDQSRTFGPSGIVILPQQNILTGSIVITDLTGLIFYSEGLDFDVDDFGVRVEIRRIPGGLIGPSQTVLIDYEIGPDPGSRTTSTNLGFSIRYTLNEGFLNGLSLYGRYRDLSPDRDSDGNTALPVSELTELTYGAEYTFWRFTLLAEQQNHESTLSPFDKTRLEAEYRQFFGRNNTLRIRGFHQIISRDSGASESTTSNLTARFKSRISSRWSASALAIYREESDSRGSNFRGFEQSLELTMQHRQTFLSASIKNIWSESNSSDNNFQTLVIGFRREF